MSTFTANERGLKLKKIFEEYFISSASEDAQMVIDTKLHVDETTLNNLTKRPLQKIQNYSGNNYIQ
eukprot:395259-Ditylum_brightwellii.AAC.1